jgi:spore germination cell wall hydrolase CwlJ-like protein
MTARQTQADALGCAPGMDDATLLALCVWDEAAGEMHEGKVAVAKVVYNRMALHYQSDGTVQGTVLAPNQFSGFWFSMFNGRYVRDCWTLPEALAKAARMLNEASQQAIWPDCQLAAEQASTGFQGGPEWQKLEAEPKTVLYANLAISNPAWAMPENKVATIGHHTFFKDHPAA